MKHCLRSLNVYIGTSDQRGDFFDGNQFSYIRIVHIYCIMYNIRFRIQKTPIKQWMYFYNWNAGKCDCRSLIAVIFKISAFFLRFR